MDVRGPVTESKRAQCAYIGAGQAVWRWDGITMIHGFSEMLRERIEVAGDAGYVAVLRQEKGEQALPRVLAEDAEARPATHPLTYKRVPTEASPDRGQVIVEAKIASYQVTGQALKFNVTVAGISCNESITHDPLETLVHTSPGKSLASHETCFKVNGTGDPHR